MPNVNKVRTKTTEKLAQMQSLHYRMLQIAIVLDEEYVDHIRESKEYWTFNFGKGRIVKLKDFIIKTSYDLFMPLFRSEDDARVACRLLRNPIKKLYGERKQKSN